MSMGLYVHVPFCARRCDYCDFFVVVGRQHEGEFFDALEIELREAAGRLAGAGPLDTLYIGGGTPSYVDPGRIEALISLASGSFGIEDGAEITLEANPEGIDPRAARRWLGAGVNRLSLGIQSLSDPVLGPRGRLYTAREAVEAWRAARAAGFGNISADLIAGLPGETPATFGEGIERVIDLGPEHVSVYLLETADSGKLTSLSEALDGGRVVAVPEEEIVDMYSAAVERLAAAGLRQYEISNFARPGLESRHNLKYWTSAEWIGVGPSAHSFIGGRRLSRPADLGAWSGQVRSAEPGRDYTLPGAGDRAREALVLELRLIEGVDLREFAGRWSFDASVELAAVLDDLVSCGLARREGDRLALTPRGILFSNDVFGRLT